VLLACRLLTGCRYVQGGIDRGWFRHPRSTKDGKPHLPSILAIAADIASAMTYLHSVSRACATRADAARQKLRLILTFTAVLLDQ
jgi:hypothetical protein